jgi:hypothetical protein
VANFLFSLDARKTFLLKALPSSRFGDGCCVIRPLVRGLCLESIQNQPSFLRPKFWALVSELFSSWFFVVYDQKGGGDGFVRWIEEKQVLLHFSETRYKQVGALTVPSAVIRESNEFKGPLVSHTCQSVTQCHNVSH